MVIGRPAAVILVAAVLAGCGGSSASHPSNGDIDRVNQRTSDLNAAYERLRVGVNACNLGAAPATLATCFDEAYTASSVDSVLAAFDQQIQQIEGRLDSGACRSSFGQFDSTLVALRKAVATMKGDFDAGATSSLASDGQAVQDAWKTSVHANAQANKAC
jgi:outer membrane murein-binding lipoprotein Lpp